MTSERVQRRIERLLDQAEEAADRRDWAQVAESVQMVLGVDPENADALAFQAMLDNAGVGGATAPTSNASSEVLEERDQQVDSVPLEPVPSRTSGHGGDPAPTSFANGRYAVTRFLGEGGKKRVYLAHDTLLDREVAFGLIKTEGFDQASKERISREAQAMGRLGVHPNIVAVLDLGQETGGAPYMVTEFMSGGDVEGLLASTTVGAGSGPPSRPTPTASFAAGGAGPSHGEGSLTPPPLEGGGLEVGRNGLSLERTIEIGKAVCEGLEFAHGRGIIHRDLKPGNVWLSEDGVAKIGDFGLAMLTDRSRLTREAMMIGTPFYMPPEQATGGDMTPRSDLYSLGAMLYEMVTGRPPFLGDEEIAIIGQHINTPPVAPTWHNGECPRPLEALIMRLLAKDPAERPESAQDVFNALDAIDLTARGEIVERDSNSLESLAGGVFVGRQAEMDQLKAGLEDVLGGSGRLMTLVGEPGIGKTRTSEEFVTYARLRGAQALWGRCYETGGQPPYWPWVQAIRSYVREVDADELRRQMGSSASVMSEIVTDIRDRLPEVQPPPTIEDPDSARFRLFDSIASFLRSASQSQPLVIVLDDLHWSDRPSLQFLEFMARELGQSRVLLLGTYRDMELNRRHPLTVTLGDLARERLYERVLLRGLSEADVGRFIEIAAGIQPPRELSATVFRHTEGNPLFVTEVVRELVQSGDLAENRASGDSTWSVRIPEGVREVIGRRLDRLSERANEILTTAAVVGRDFTLPVIRELAEDTTESQLLDVLDEALDARLIEELTDSVGHYQFTHALMQETLTSELSLTRRVRMHARVAETLERYYGDKAEDHAGVLSAHFSEAETVLGTDRLVKYLVAAGQASLDSLGYDDAFVYFDKAFSVVSADPDGFSEDRVADVYWGRGQARAVRGPIAERQSAWEDLAVAFDMYLDSGQQERAVQVALNPIVLGGLQGPADVYERALGIVPAGSTDAGWLQTRYGTALMDNRQAFEQAEEAFAKAEKTATDTSNDGLMARVNAHLCQLSFHRALPEKIVQHGEAAAHFARTGDEPSSAMRSAAFWAIGEGYRGDLNAAFRIAERNWLLSESRNTQAWASASRMMGASVGLMKGDWDLVRGCMDGLRPGFDGFVEPEVTRGYLDVISGERTADRDKMVAVAQIGADAGGFGFAVGHGLKTAQILDDPEIYELFLEAEPSVWTAFRQYRGFGLSRNLVIGLAAARLRDADRCRELYADIVDAGFVFETTVAISFELVKAELAVAFQDTGAAEEHFSKALVQLPETGAYAELAWALIYYSEMLLDRAAEDPASASGFADREKAIDLQDQALALTRELGMVPLTERILARREILRA